MAEQEQPVRRMVALKVIKPGMDSRQVIARFEAERQALAIMDHVNIARVFDGGATEAGRPYFVMELVHGVPITKYMANLASAHLAAGQQDQALPLFEEALKLMGIDHPIRLAGMASLATAYQAGGKLDLALPALAGRDPNPEEAHYSTL
jgi:serine/threonine protein kinase